MWLSVTNSRLKIAHNELTNSLPPSSDNTTPITTATLVWEALEKLSALFRRAHNACFKYSKGSKKIHGGSVEVLSHVRCVWEGVFAATIVFSPLKSYRDITAANANRTELKISSITVHGAEEDLPPQGLPTDNIFKEVTWEARGALNYLAAKYESKVCSPTPTLAVLGHNLFSLLSSNT
jgi:hypothetical protein